MRYLLFLAVIFTCILSCKKNDTPLVQLPVQAPIYFPPIGSAVWETTTPISLGWNETELNSLYTYLNQKNTKAFIILKNGRIVVEKYFNTFTADSNWYWASAGKTMTGFLIGIAQQEGLININNKTSTYLGTGWTTLSIAKENLITVRNQLTMTTGLDDGVADQDCTLPACLQYKVDAGTRWAYHNGPYTILDKVVETATGTTYNNYFRQKIRDRIGMNGQWVRSGYNNVYYSTARSMARFGLLLLNKGKWNSTSILSDSNYFNNQVNTSQTFNSSYGYLTWLNGKSNYMLPTVQNVFNGPLIPNAPSDMYAALGKNDQRIYVIPSMNIVAIRLGEDAGNSSLALSSFDNELWGKLKLVIKY